MSSIAETQQRIRAQIINDRPAAIAGPAAFWAQLIDVPEAQTLAALTQLVTLGELRCQPLGEDHYFIADPPHAPLRDDHPPPDSPAE